MLRRLEIKDFKSFHETCVPFGPFTLLVGANASGKSNVRDALRFLQGVSRGYSLAEILGEKWGSGGELEWGGIRGGAVQSFRWRAREFSIAADFEFMDPSGGRSEVRYEIAVEFQDAGIPVLSRERFMADGWFGYETHPDGRGLEVDDRTIIARTYAGVRGRPSDERFVRDRPIFDQFLGNRRSFWDPVMGAVRFLESMRFLDLDPDLARRSSPRGVKTLGDRGQNLSSVLAHLADEPAVREGVVGWIRALTPMDAVDIDFHGDLNNRVLAVLVESDGQRTPLSSASDGTVRFLTMVALLFMTEPPSLLFLEEIENGIHPYRLSLLLDLIEQRVGDGKVQVAATSHSPRLLQDAWVSENTKPVLVVRAPGRGSIAVDVEEEPRLNGIVDGGEAGVGSPADLMSEGWFEDVSDFLFSAEDSDES